MRLAQNHDENRRHVCCRHQLDAKRGELTLHDGQVREGDHLYFSMLFRVTLIYFFGEIYLYTTQDRCG